MSVNDLNDLRSQLRGDVFESGSPEFDGARSLWNVRFDRRPDTVARCADAADIRTVVGYARAEGLPLSVKGGGHSYAANSVRDGGILIDLSRLNDVTVDDARRRATVGGGTTCRELDAAAQQLGLATPVPTVSSVGVAGAALGGGSGYLTRKHGLSLDNLASVELVTADGRAITASRDEEPELFWGLRGGGGNLGIATSIELELHEVGPQVLSGQVIYPIQRAGELLRFFRDFMADAPNEFQCYPFMFRVPPIDLFPAETHGQPVLDFVLYHQDPGATDFVQPLRNFGGAILDIVAPAPYATVQQGFDPNLPRGHRYYSKAHDLDDMTDAAIDTVLEYVPRMRGAFTAAYFEPLGGAFAAVDDDATAYGSRRARYSFHCLAGWMDPAEDEEVMSWSSQFHRAMAPHANGGVYVNLIADDESARIPAAYGDNYARLAELKRRYDPENLFQSNYNIPPSADG